MCVAAIDEFSLYLFIEQGEQTHGKECTWEKHHDSQCDRGHLTSVASSRGCNIHIGVKRTVTFQFRKNGS